MQTTSNSLEIASSGLPFLSESFWVNSGNLEAVLNGMPFVTSNKSFAIQATEAGKFEFVHNGLPSNFYTNAASNTSEFVADGSPLCFVVNASEIALTQPFSYSICIESSSVTEMQYIVGMPAPAMPAIVSLIGAPYRIECTSDWPLYTEMIEVEWEAL